MSPSGHRLRRCAPVVVALAALAVPAVAAAEPGIGTADTFTASFSTTRPATATGLKLETTGSPPVAPITLTPMVRQTVILPTGTRLRPTELPQCTATDEQLAADGAEGACPAQSRVGTGRAEGLLDGSTPSGFDLGVYAVRGDLFFAAEIAGQPLKRGFYGVATGRRLALTVPTAGGRLAPTLFRMQVPARPGGAKWLRTPERCPSSGRWTVRTVFQGLDAAGMPAGASQSLSTTTRCR